MQFSPRTRRRLIVAPVAVAVLGLVASCSSGSTDDNTGTSTTTSSAPTTAATPYGIDYALPGAAFTLGEGGSAIRQRAGSYTVVGDDSDGFCGTGKEDGVLINVSDPNAGDKAAERLVVQGPVSDTPVPGRVSIQFNTTDAGNTVGGDSLKDGGANAGDAEVTITETDDGLYASYKGTTWDGITIEGTAACSLG